MSESHVLTTSGVRSRLNFYDDRRRYDHVSVQGRQHVDVFDQNQIPEWACISDDSHADRRSTITLGRQFILALLPKPGAGLAFTLEVPE
jgi:hypothetical protein